MKAVRMVVLMVETRAVMRVSMKADWKVD